MVVEKRCTKCGIIKPITEFYPNVHNKTDGHRYRCKVCENTPPLVYKQISEKVCSKCGMRKPTSEYNRQKLSLDGYYPECKHCMRKMNLAYASKNKEINTDKNMYLGGVNILKVCASCKENKYISQFNIKRSTKDGYDIYCKECTRKKKNDKYCSHSMLSIDEYKSWRKRENCIRKNEKKRLKIDVFSHYCPNGIIKCANLFQLHKEEIIDLDILTIDHINGDGYMDKDKNGRRCGGVIFYRKLKKQNYPSGYQVLCGNCQMKKKVLNQEY